ncbi:ABC transporter ATP-binding protein [Acidilutibacter cellobiosedens]|uniref:ABC transporter ATP-binding protein n=1 Tax=Acidilutibacter cellobiosedens TaxID=2507161 RepID=A0A410QE87_9FIRM|nr:ABC transporter ATP-binding protein [Acidilutibacter cellobiosedens]QAT62300.1 ABC transporter ATP-binding protein [Acidilutibacter cellobiosedens]
MKSFLVLKDFFIKNKWKYFFGVIWLIIIDIVQLIVPQILRIVTNLLQNNLLTFNELIKYSLYIILTGLIIAVGRYYWRIYLQGTARTLEYYLRNKLFRHLLTLSTNYFNTHKTGDLMAHATNDINSVRMALGQGVVMIVDAVFMTFFSVIMMIHTTNLKLTLVAISTLPFIAIVVGKFGKIIHKRFIKVQEAFSDLTDTAQENFAGIRVIKSFVQEENEIKKFSVVNNNNLSKNLSLVKISGIFHPLVQFMSSISFLIVLWYGGILVIRDDISLGDFVAFNSYLSSMVWPMMATGWVINLFQRGAASMDRLNIIFEEKPEITDSKDAIDIKNMKGEIEFKNVSFKYPHSENYAVKNLNFKIPSDHSLAIVGRTGSGKSTIVSLLLRLYDIDEGEILIDGINIKDMTIKSLRENIGYVPQENFLFSDSIINNIAFSFEEEEKYNEDLIYNASRTAEVYDNIIEFPNKFETVLGERGVTLSGGQKQRVSIARAIIKDSSVLILDDSLSSVDTDTEERILSNLREVIKKRTTIIISHRISTIKDSDEILVIDEGEIVARGNHDSLVKQDGIYKDLYEKQLLEEKIQKN